MGYTWPARVERTNEYRDCIDGLQDLAGRARILMRVDRLIHGNPGAHRELTDAVSELKVDVGPGYRVYCTQRGDRLLLLLIGGDNASQDRDNARAKRLARAYGD